MSGLFSKKGRDKFGSLSPGEVSSPLDFIGKRVANSLEGKPIMAVIGQKVYIKGEIGGDEDVVIEGRVEGRIKLKKHLIINKGGIVRAEVSADRITVAGKLIGTANARTKLEILPSGYLEGDIKTPNIVISEGGHFKGNIDMSQTPEPSALVGKKEKRHPKDKKEGVKEISLPKSEEPPSSQSPKQ